jgi:hypothetical protein
MSSPKGGVVRVALAEQAASAASVHCCDKSNDDTGGCNGDSNDGGAQDDNRRNYGAHNEDVDEGAMAGVVESEDGVAAEQ